MAECTGSAVPARVGSDSVARAFRPRGPIARVTSVTTKERLISTETRFFLRNPARQTRRSAAEWRSVRRNARSARNRARHLPALEPSVRHEPPEHREARVDVVVGVVVVAFVERQAADDAQTGAVLAIERRDREGEHDRLADRPLEV